MRLGSLWQLVARDLGRTRGALVTSGFGIAAGTAALVFFLALGLGVRAVLLGEVFPIDQVELEPPKGKDPGLLGLLIGAGGEAPSIGRDDLAVLEQSPGVTGVYPKLRFAFPASGHGGKELFGYDVSTGELVGDGIDPSLVRGEVAPSARFVDPLAHPGPACVDDQTCTAGTYCEKASGASRGVCSEPVPILVSRYLVEVFDKSIAPAHHLPPVGETIVARASSMTFSIRLGESLLGKGRRGTPRTARVRIVGISKRAIDLGVTLPIEVVRRWNREFAGDAAAERYSSAIVQVSGSRAMTDLLARAAERHLDPKDTRARDVSVLVTSLIALLALVALVILVVSASNIAYTFRVLVAERHRELALYRALGASARDMRVWMMCLALVVGVVGGGVGLGAARLLGFATDWVAATRLPDFPFKPTSFFAFSYELCGAGVAFGALFAALGAFGPARRAARVDPSTALAGD